MYAKELKTHKSWWQDPQWLHELQSSWPTNLEVISIPVPAEERGGKSEWCSVTVEKSEWLSDVSSFRHLKRVTVWILRFIHNCQSKETKRTASLRSDELHTAERVWIRRSQTESFSAEINDLKKGKPPGKLTPYHPFIDKRGILRVGGRMTCTHLPFELRHPIILHGKHRITRLIIGAEHIRLLHVGITLTSGSLQRRYCMIKGRTAVCAIIRRYVTRRKIDLKPNTQMMGQLPTDRMKIGNIFECVGINYAGPIMVKLGPITRPILTKAYTVNAQIFVGTIFRGLNFRGD